MEQTISLPVKATYKIVDGKPIMTAAQYADVQMEAVLQHLLMGYWAATGNEVKQCN